MVFFVEPGQVHIPVLPLPPCVSVALATTASPSATRLVVRIRKAAGGVITRESPQWGVTGCWADAG